MTVKWFGDDILGKVRQAAMRGVIASVEDVLTEADSLMNDTPRDGRVYRRRGVEHVASSPGNPPAPDTGRLRQSLHSEYDPSDLSGEAIASTEYAEVQEFGSAKQAPRPFMRPALANQKENIVKTINDEVAGALKG